MKKLYLLFVMALASGCVPHLDDENTNKKVMGYKPVYIDYASARKIEVQKARSLSHPGKIYIKGNYLYVGEAGEGIHIFDNTDKASPKPVAFISIPVNKDISIKGNILYADNADDLVTIDISDLQKIKVLKRIEKAFPFPSFPNEIGWFECVNPNKGYVKGWEYVELLNPKCRR
ncbi:hypothetical protein [Emticicia sp. TH156]|uniref:hypothetical protein n=1 Tax=Emticicia sp. TH156 TaxID=2067454 RepID=UPI000C771F48|nr:hypothetical protein [Emticicia sp. TH156]PLK45589.1 hypothetical protein C0V77_05525 [Emticicia sp. TH156]